MRISELSRATGVPIPTIKFYLRERLLPAGTLTSSNQATYDEEHARTLRLIRVLVEVGGLSLEAVGRVLETLARGDGPLHEVLAVAHTALRHDPGSADPDLPAARAEVDGWLAERGWTLAPATPAGDELAAALLALRQLGWPVGPEAFDRYAKHADELARAEVDYVAAATDRRAAVEAMVIGTVVFGRALAALRMLAQEHHSRASLGG